MKLPPFLRRAGRQLAAAAADELVRVGPAAVLRVLEQATTARAAPLVAPPSRPAPVSFGGPVAPSGAPFGAPTAASPGPVVYGAPARPGRVVWVEVLDPAGRVVGRAPVEVDDDGPSEA